MCLETCVDQQDGRLISGDGNMTKQENRPHVNLNSQPAVSAHCLSPIPLKINDPATTSVDRVILL